MMLTLQGESLAGARGGLFKHATVQRPEHDRSFRGGEAGEGCEGEVLIVGRR